MASSNEKYEVPEICYEEPKPGHDPNPFPFINVKRLSRMPTVLFIEERKETGKIEPGYAGEQEEVVDLLMHKFVDLEFLKEKLPPHLNDIVRVALGMKPLKEAQELGQKILDKASQNAQKIKEELLQRKAAATKKDK